ncbi:hypothetical protein [uncultured Desulfovibrio sp.]|uniref:hypothetical protein n=1 Tax=uncultured Desulfovibrio sp. TaxID=167968 RepID=UPI00261C2753|nr:hypothetical protein [uncultured Desulfovibrio sp.]
MRVAYQCYATGEYAGSFECWDEVLPNGATWIAPPEAREGHVRCFLDGKWVQVEDHRERKAGQGDAAQAGAQPATDYWLPGDTYDTPARHMHAPGPLPAGALLERPEKPVSLARTEKQQAIHSAYEAALAGAVALADPSPATVAVEAGLLAASDAEGLEWLRDSLAARRDALLDLVATAETAAAVEAVDITFNV